MSTRLAVAIAVLGALACSVAGAAPIPALYNTGVDGTGAALATGAVDPHYRLIASADANWPGPSAYACFPIAGIYWSPNGADSRWIAPAVDEDYPALGTAHPAGDYSYRLDVDLTGFDPATVTIGGLWGVDNGGSILLNGSATGISTTNYNPLVAFSISSGWVSGVNHLDFVIQNWAAGGSNPTGLRVAGLTGSGTPSSTGVGPPRSGSAPSLAPPSPNPTADRVALSGSLPRASHARLLILDMAGRRVRTLLDETSPAGAFTQIWDGGTDRGTRAEAGLYFITLEAGATRISRRLVWLR